VVAHLHGVEARASAFNVKLGVGHVQTLIVDVAADWLVTGITRGAPYHPMTQGKIERWHRSMKNQVLLENYYLPSELKARISAFVDYYNTERYHESLKNLTPEDVYTGRGQTVLNRRRRIKQKTLAERRRLYYQRKAA
jgi:transposase InsO family protein